MADRDTVVWLIEDNAPYRRAVARALNTTPGLSCPLEFATCEDALVALTGDDRPDVILLDVGLPGMSGLEGIGRIRAVSPQTQVLVLTVFEDDDKVFSAVCAGAAGYLLKSASLEQLTEAVREVRSGGSPMNARIARRVLEMFTRLAPPPAADYGLTDREVEILRWLVRGLIKKEVGRELGLSVHTVDSHVRSIYEKLHVHSRSEAVAKAIKEKLI